MNNIWLKKFKRDIIPQLVHEFDPQKLILFGSQINGEADEDSDIDVIIVSKAFAGVPFIKRMPMLLRKFKFEKHIDFICYSPAEFKRIKNKSSTVIDALNNGEFVIS